MHDATLRVHRKNRIMQYHDNGKLFELPQYSPDFDVSFLFEITYLESEAPFCKLNMKCTIPKLITFNYYILFKYFKIT